MKPLNKVMRQIWDACYLGDPKKRPYTFQELAEQRDADALTRQKVSANKFIDCIGKMDVNKETDDTIVAMLYKSKPHTLKIDGLYDLTPKAVPRVMKRMTSWQHA